MDINQFILDSYITTNQQQIQLLEQAIQFAKMNIAFFTGCKESKKNTTNNALNLINKGDNMKFQGKTIFKNTTCDTWYTRYRENGVQHYISGKTQKDVLNKLKDKLKYISKQHIKKLNTTLLEWYNQWLKLFKIGNVKDITIKQYEKCLRHIDNSILNKDITQINSIEIMETLNNIEHERIRQQVYELLNTLFTKAKQHEKVHKNIMEIIEKPKHIREKGIALTNKEQELFCNYCRDYIYGDIFLVTLYQGLRVGEVLAITGEDINLTNNTLTINKSLNSSGEIDTTKNNQSNRTMPIFDNTRIILEKYKNYGKQRIFDISYNVPQKHLKKIIEDIKIRDISPHDLRHTFVTNCKNKGIPEHIVQSWIGHNIGSDVTRRIYTHTNEEDVKEYIEIYNKSI